MKMLSNRTGGFLPALILAVMLVLGLSVQKAGAQDYYDNYGNGNNDGNYQEFYDDLAPYGQWMNDPQYGYVWSPNVGSDFRPYYTNGQWVMTEYGNTWVSNYNWGWAPFHYGRWAQGSFGWIWIPGNTWGPAWVNWRQGGGYYGWAPMGPGISINISFGGYNIPNPWWTFIPCGNIYSSGWQRYYSPRRTVNIINNTTIINNTYVDNRSRNTYVTGPRRNEIEAVTRQKVTVYNVNNRTRSGATNVSGRSVNVYRPNIATTSGRGQVSAPKQVKTLERSVITNTGGGRAPAKAAVTPSRNNNSPSQPRNQQTTRPSVEKSSPAQQQRIQQSSPSRNVQMQRDQQVQQQNVQRQQLQQQQVQQREQQMQQRQQVQQQQNMQRQAQPQQQRIERSAAQPQRVERSAPAQPQRVERSTPQPQRVERSAPAQPQRSVERSAPRGR